MSGTNAPRLSSKSVTKISPLLPIAILLVTSAQAYKVLHKFILATPQASKIDEICAKIPGRYFGSLGMVDLRPLDGLTCALVQIFSVVIYHPASRIVLLEFMGLIAVVAIIGLISSSRSSAGTLVKWGTTTAFMIMQVIGGAVVLPIYYILIVWKSSSSARASFMPSGSARALLPAVLFGFLIPSIFLLAPEFFQNQAFLEWGIAVWQLFPILVSFVATTLGFCFSGSDSRSITTTEAVISTTFIVSSLDTTILISFVLHLYAIYSIYNQGLTISTFLPNSDFGTAEDAFYAFFAIDLLGCLISTWTLIFYDTSRYAGVGKTSVLSAALIAVFGTLLFGPGGAAAVRTFPQKIKFERIKIDEI